MRHRLILQVLTWGVLSAWAAAIAGAQEPSEREVLLLGARNAWKSGAHEKAIARYRLAIERDPTQWDAIAELGWLFIELGRSSEALQQFEALAKLPPDDPLAVREYLRGFLTLRHLKRVDRELSALRAPWAGERWARLALADLRLTQMRYREAEALYAQLARQDQDREATIGLADVATALGDHQQAAEILDRLHAAFPQDPEIARRRVVNLASRQRVIEAFRELEGVEPEARRQAIEAELRNIFGEHVQAERLFESLRARRPVDYGLLIGAAEAWLGQEDDRGAEAAYSAILRQYPEDVRARLGLAELWLASGRYHEAETIVRTLRHDAPSSASVQYTEVKLHLAQGHRALAREQSRRMAETIASLTEAKTIQRRMLKDGDFSSVVAFSEVVIARGLHDGQFLQGYLDGFVGKGEIARGKVVAASVLKQAPASSPIRLALARFYLVAGDRAKARDFLRHDEGGTETGALYYDLKDYGDSRLAYESVLKRDPANLAAALGLARTLSAEGHPDQAGELLRRLVERVPGPGRTAAGLLLAGASGGTPDFYRVVDDVLETLEREHPASLDLQLARANVSIQGRQNRTAIARLRRLKEARPDSPLVVLRLGRALSYEREIGEASAVYDEYLRIKPYDVAARREKARAYGWAFEYERALTEFDEILNRFPDDAATALEREGKQALWLGQLRRARRALDTLAELEPRNSETLFDLGQIAPLSGRPSEAQELYRRLMSVAPGHRQAELALELSEMSQRPLLALGYAFTNQQGFDGKRSIRYGLATAEGRVRISDDVSARLGYQNAQFLFGRDSLLANMETVGLLYSPNGYLHVDGFVTALHYDGLGRDHVNVGAGVSYDTLSGMTLRADFERKDLWENRTTVLDGIVVHRLSASVRGGLGTRFDWTIRADYSNYSDDNTRVGGEFLASYRLLWFPKTVRLIYRVNAFGFQRERSYFSPGAYATNTVAAEFQHWLGYPTEEDYLAEAPRNRYAVYYGISVDSNGKVFHEWQGKLAYALARHIEVGPSLKVIRSSVYNEWGAGALIEYTF